MKSVQYKAGDTIAGRYRIKSIIAQGGFAVVYLATRREDGVDVAVKTLKKKAMEQDHAAMRRLEREARVAETINHPHSVRLFDYGYTKDNRVYLVMELLEGKTLEHYVKSGKRFEPGAVQGMIVQLLGALGEIHEKGLVHRDIKPGNIFLLDNAPSAEDGVFIKLLDFGFVKVLNAGAVGEVEGETNLTHQGLVLGTPGYLAPEALQGVTVTTRADLYAVGLVGYELLAGAQAYTGSPMEKIQKQMKGNPPALEGALHDLRVAAVIERLMERNPSKRYATASEALADLNAIKDPSARRKRWWQFW